MKLLPDVSLHLRVHQYAIHLCRAMNAYYQGLLYVGSAAGAGGEINHGWEGRAILSFHKFDTVFDIVNDLIHKCKDYVHRIINRRGAPHILAAAQ
jgi:hypothetical protein